MVRGVLLAILLVAGTTNALAQQPPSKAKTRQIAVEPVYHDPLVVFIAEGPPNSCGPGCNRWIAAEGAFDPGSAERVIRILEGYKNLRLPIYFHSRGGRTQEAHEVGHHLRKLNMKAGVARTALQRCAGHATSNECRKIISSFGDRSAQLVPREGLCASACVYAFLGATSRTVDGRARIGVHATKATPTKEARAKIEPAKLAKHLNEIRERGERDNWGYVGRMGVDPGLVDLAAKIDPNAVRFLTRAELIRFGVITTDRFETPWIGRDETPNAAYSLFKILTSRSSADSNIHLTTTVGITCYRRERVTIYVERELLPGESGHEPIIRVLSDEKAAWISTNRININARTDYRAEVMPLDEVMKLVPKRSFELKLDYPTPEWASKSATIKLSIAGLEPALKRMQRECERIHAPKPEATRTAAQQPPATPLIDGPSENCNFVICETPWTERREGSQTYILFKTVTQKSPATDNTLSTTIGLSCRTPQEVDLFVGRTPGRDEGPTGPTIRVVSDGTVIWMSKERAETNTNLDYRSQVIPFHEILSVAPRKSLEYTETFEGPLAGRSRTTKLSIEGLKAALLKMEGRCGQAQPTAPQSAQTER